MLARLIYYIMTNDEIVLNIMNHSKYGALSQVFVLQAIHKLAQQVIDNEPGLLQSIAEQEKEGRVSIINVHSWIGVAKEIKEKLDNNIYS